MVEVSHVLRELDSHPQLAWEVHKRLHGVWFLGNWRQRTMGYTWDTPDGKAGPSAAHPDGVLCWNRRTAGTQAGNHAARIEYIESKGHWRWRASRWRRALDIEGSGGAADSLEEAKAAADAVLVGLGAKFVDDSASFRRC